MARIKSGIIADAHGSVGELTYLGTKNGSLITKARTAPTYPATASQLKIVQAQADINTRWLNLTSAQRLAWLEYSQAHPIQNPKTGTFLHLTGREMFHRRLFLNRYLNLRGLFADTGNDDAPLTGNFHPPLITLLTSGAPVVTSIYVTASNDTDYDYTGVVLRSNVQPATVNRYYGPYNSLSWKLLAQFFNKNTTQTRAASNFFPSAGRYWVRVYFFRRRSSNQFGQLAGHFRQFIYNRP